MRFENDVQHYFQHLTAIVEVVMEAGNNVYTLLLACRGGLFQNSDPGTKVNHDRCKTMEMTMVMPEQPCAWIRRVASLSETDLEGGLKIINKNAIHAFARAIGHTHFLLPAGDIFLSGLPWICCRMEVEWR
jgi:hypothetical protein